MAAAAFGESVPTPPAQDFLAKNGLEGLAADLTFSGDHTIYYNP